MELSKDTQLMELAVSKAASYQELLDEQKDVFQNQIEKLQEIVATQCKLTGVNPLSQEMAAGALSIKIGKRPRDLLNPKAVKYMQLVFSMKDAISKRETREISAQFGVTVTQVRDFFTGQRSRVRKFVRLSREKANRSSACDLVPDGITSTSSPNMIAEPIPLDTIPPTPINTDEGPSCSKAHEGLSAMTDSDRHFVENIFGLMRKEESFSGHVKLLRWILQMKNPSVLNWFFTEGGLMILATWLCEAAKEEQTSFLSIILKRTGSRFTLPTNQPMTAKEAIEQIRRHVSSCYEVDGNVDIQLQAKKARNAKFLTITQIHVCTSFDFIPTCYDTKYFKTFAGEIQGELDEVLLEKDILY